ncbi:MAG: hypothetical protein K2R98_31585 [Gemmataceae bacterium]|nr:hypothetical protein [Gemmataceae bacterium]
MEQKKRSDERKDAPQGPAKGTPERTLAAAPRTGSVVKALFWSFKDVRRPGWPFLSIKTLFLNSTTRHLALSIKESGYRSEGAKSTVVGTSERDTTGPPVAVRLDG